MLKVASSKLRKTCLLSHVGLIFTKPRGHPLSSGYRLSTPLLLREAPCCKKSINCWISNADAQSSIRTAKQGSHKSYMISGGFVPHEICLYFNLQGEIYHNFDIHCELQRNTFLYVYTLKLRRKRGVDSTCKLN